MIRRLIARLVARFRPQPVDNLPDDDMADWRAWQERDYHEQLRGTDPLP